MIVRSLSNNKPCPAPERFQVKIKKFKNKMEATKDDWVKQGQFYKSYQKFLFRRFISEFRGYPILILPHRDPDWDALGSAAAIHKHTNWSIAIEGEPSVAAINGIIAFGIKFQKIKDVDFNKVCGVIVMDTSDEDRIPYFPKNIPLLAVIDHRKKILQGKDEKLCLSITDESFSSTCEIIARYLPLRSSDADIAKLLAIGMLSDTLIFRRRMNDDMFNFFSKLINRFGINFEDLKKHVFDRFTSEEEFGMLESIKHALHFLINNLHISVVNHPVPKKAHLTSISTSLLSRSNFAMAFSQMPHADYTHFSFKVREEDAEVINCKQLSQRIIHKLGGHGGGHKMGSGGAVSASAVKVAIEVIHILAELGPIRTISSDENFSSEFNQQIIKKLRSEGLIGDNTLYFSYSSRQPLHDM